MPGTVLKDAFNLKASFKSRMTMQIPIHKGGGRRPPPLWMGICVVMWDLSQYINLKAYVKTVPGMGAFKRHKIAHIEYIVVL